MSNQSNPAINILDTCVVFWAHDSFLTSESWRALIESMKLIYFDKVVLNLN